jgi:macrolide-specific efflux system membrane fusion protein
MNKKLLIAAALGYMLLFTTGCSGTSEKVPFETVRAFKGNIENPIVATGIIKPKIGAEVKVGSRVSGVVKKLYVKNGDQVHEGQLLAILDDEELSARYRIEQANLANAITILKYAEIEQNRLNSLLLKDFATQQAYDIQVKETDLARSKVASQQAMVDYAATQLKYTRICAPISGVIGSVSTQEGETVTAAFVSPTFVTIIDLSRIEVWAYIDETDIGKIHTGQDAVFSVDTYPETKFKGTITAIYPKAEIRDNVVNYIAIVDIMENQGLQLRPEMTTNVTITESSRNNIICIPENALFHDPSGTMVYLLADNKPVKRQVKTGIRGNNLVEIKEGLKENDQVITNYDLSIQK